MMGSRVGPPTRMTASRSCAVIFALCSASSQTLKVRCTRSITILLNSASLRVAARSIRSDEDDGVQVLRGHLRALQRLVADLEGPLHQVHHHLVELGFAEGGGEIHHLAGGVLADAAAQVGVARGGEDLEDVLADLEDGDVEGAAAEVVDRDLLRDVLPESVRERGGG